MPPTRTHLLIRLVFAGFLLAQFAAATAAAAASSQHDVLWSVHGDAGHAGYLMGTVHSEDPRVLEFTEPFLETLGDCETFAMELVPNLPTMQRLLDIMQLPPGQSLEALVGPDRFAAVETAMAAYGVPDDRLRAMKPWAAMMTLSLPPPKSGLFLDFSLSLRAAGMGLQVVGLETLEEQLAFLEDMPLDDQLALLDQTLAEHDRVQEVHDQLVDGYLWTDLDALQRLAVEQMASVPEEARERFMAEGIDARNERMAANALPLLDQGCAFIAVGALHLPGEKGLMTLLREAGYRLEPLPSPFVEVHQRPDAQAVDQ